MIIKVVCEECKKVITEGELKDGKHSSGVCEDCFDRTIKEMDKEMDTEKSVGSPRDVLERLYILSDRGKGEKAPCS